jgi:hypothetical protein
LGGKKLSSFIAATLTFHIDSRDFIPFHVS